MGTEILNLQHELEQAKHSLKDVDEHLKKLIGRDPSELPPRIIKRPVPDDKGRPVVKGLGRGRPFLFENEEPPNKRRPTSVFNRLSEKVPDMPQKGLISKVIVTPKEVPSREEALQAQNKDEKFRARNRRMFGALLGTLQKFQQEETKLKPREDKRAQLEKKIEEHEIKEKEEIRRERQELFLNRKKKQAEIKIIELKMLRMKEYNAWEETQKPRKTFIITKSKPHIHYLPRKLNDKSKALLASSRAQIEDLIETKKQQVTEELQHIESRIKRNFENRIVMKPENIESSEQDVQDNDEPLEDVLTESQIAVANVNKKQNDYESKVVQDQEDEIINELSESSDKKTIPEETNNVDVDDCVNSEQSLTYQENISSENIGIIQEETETITQIINEELKE